MYEVEIQEMGCYFYSFSGAEFSFCCLFGIFYNILGYWCFYYNFIFEKKNVKIP